MKSEHGPGCGVDAHSEHCLCDVIITDPVPINYSFAECWDHASLIAAETGWEDGEDEGFAGYLSKLIETYDKTRGVRDSVGSGATATKETREQVSEYLRAGGSIIDAPRATGKEWGDIIVSLTSGRWSPCWAWSPQAWKTLEDSLRIGDYGHHKLATEHGLTPHTIKTLQSIYGVQRAKSREAERRDYLRQLLADEPNLTNAEYVTRLKQAGYAVHPATVRRFIQRTNQTTSNP